MRTAMLPFVDVVCRDGFVTDKAINATLTAIADIFDSYSKGDNIQI